MIEIYLLEALCALYDYGTLSAAAEHLHISQPALSRSMQKLEDLGKTPIIVTSPIVRIYFRKLTEDYYKDLIVVSYNEVDSSVNLTSVGMVTA